MDDPEDDYNGSHSILTWAKDTILTPFYILTSPALLRTYLRTLLLLLTSTFLFALAVIAYSSFYLSYIPVRGVDVPVYLQFPTSAAAMHLTFPYGVAKLEGLVSRQKYDVMVEMGLPRSEANLRAGNWMVGLEIRGPGAGPGAETGAGTLGGGFVGKMERALGWAEDWDAEDFPSMAKAEREKPPQTGGNTQDKHKIGVEAGALLARSRRPAILTYRSPLTEFTYRAIRLPFYILNFKHEAETIRVRIMEGVEFGKGWQNVPSTLRLELRSTIPLEVYKVSVKFVARLEGLRWVMYEYRFPSFVVFTVLFWGVEMCVVLVTWGFFSLVLSGAGAGGEEMQEAQGRGKVKREEGLATPKTDPDPASSAPSTPLSDTSRTFPTLSSHRRLHYSSSEAQAQVRESANIKPEPTNRIPKLEDIPLKTEAEADDEDDEDEDTNFILEEPMPNTIAGMLTDSGIGTSLESGHEGKGAWPRRRV
ncbi:uncharacterized protein BDR25DRAFT_257657 [Lindgomyces ingoldianus]|uniref:Uncharacterized protein n=1 Tax=Lindgomyces ingoldianus TaxID=673940 RepID=A0ACB6R2D6_9PLEO|nr:uncharacterized protein BDR25DRAFT_257657 [Lindgomyces ingoldianus]KAF2473306.1 hypothetical protein BDR25DRAFT_257657 [Lindgomyces ingoldianus]